MRPEPYFMSTQSEEYQKQCTGDIGFKISRVAISIHHVPPINWHGVDVLIMTHLCRRAGQATRVRWIWMATARATISVTSLVKCGGKGETSSVWRSRRAVPSSRGARGCTGES